MNFEGFDAEKARKFTDEWLPTWTGNQPEKLAAYYTDDAFYSDPAIPDGVKGKEALLAYFRKLLAKNPNWIWTHTASTPLLDGFLNHWRAEIPVGSKLVVCNGVCAVQLRGRLIYRNQVYFDRTPLFSS